MARIPINLGTNPNDGTGELLRSAWQFQNNMNEELYALQSDTINAGAVAYAAATNHGRVQLAINDAVLLGKKRVFVPAQYLPYDATLVTFNSAIRMVWEGGSYDTFDINAYGAEKDPTTMYASNGAALQAATNAAIAAGGGVVFFPEGVIGTTTGIALSGTVNVIFQGSGRNVTQLALATSGIALFDLVGTVTRVQVRDMWLGSFSARASGFGIRAISAGTAISELIVERVTFQNLPAPIYCDNLTRCTFNDVQYLQSIASATVGDVFYMIRCNGGIQITDFIAHTTTGTLPAGVITIDSDSDSVFCTKCQLINLGLGASTVGFHIKDSVGSGTNPARIVRLTDCQAELANVGFKVDYGRDIRLAGCEAALNNEQGYLFSAGATLTGLQVTGCTAYLNGKQGMWLQAGAAGARIEGNVCSNNSQAANNTYDGMVIGSSDVRVVNNRCGDFLFTTANKQKSGINLQAGTDHLIVGGNKVQGNLGSGFETPIIMSTTGASNTWLGSTFAIITESQLTAGVVLEGRAQTTWEVTLTAARAVAVPFSPHRGERITHTFIQDGTGGRNVTWAAAYKNGWVDTGNTLGKRSSISHIYDGTNWNQDGAQTPYV